MRDIDVNRFKEKFDPRITKIMTIGRSRKN